MPLTVSGQLAFFDGHLSHIRPMYKTQSTQTQTLTGRYTENTRQCAIPARMQHMAFCPELRVGGRLELSSLVLGLQG